MGKKDKQNEDTSQINRLIFRALRKLGRLDAQPTSCDFCDKETSFTVDFETGENYCLQCSLPTKVKKTAKDKLKELLG